MNIIRILLLLFLYLFSLGVSISLIYTAVHAILPGARKLAGRAYLRTLLVSIVLVSAIVVTVSYSMTIDYESVWFLIATFGCGLCAVAGAMVSWEAYDHSV
jgi:hypothetical protein